MPRKPAKAKAPEHGLNFASLVEAVRQVHERSAAAATRAVNVSLTLRNWLIGCYIVEYQQHGADRAQYGERLVDRLAAELYRQGVPASDRHGCTPTLLSIESIHRSARRSPITGILRFSPRRLGNHQRFSGHRPDNPPAPGLGKRLSGRRLE